ncbi:glycosyltransferase family 2 protein [Vibrio rhizosphaerae]|uniref:glycosyltransferase family 2 protein n=1 Tax=Vibrio rhizosphaerae TaxID=398736 RepID=UPI000A0733C0|nr:glycosyltransferase family 2 protein [Vibrio rhizosphaerae]
MNENKTYKTYDDYLNMNGIKKGGQYLNGKHKNKDMPLVSIITICRNASLTLEKTIESVIEQTYPNIEYLIIDGDSTDGTLDIIKHHEDCIDLWISEPDDGATDAINKGFTICSGEFIFLLNADDYITSDFISNAVESFDEDCDFVFGDCLIGNFGGDYSRRLQGDKNYIKKIAYTMPRINQPTIVFKKQCLDTVGLYDTAKKVAPDYDWLVRGYVKNITGKYTDKLVTYFALDGNSDKYYYKGLSEVRESSLRYAGSIFMTNFYFIVRSIKRMIKRYVLI